MSTLTRVQVSQAISKATETGVLELREVVIAHLPSSCFVDMYATQMLLDACYRLGRPLNEAETSAILQLRASLN